MTTLKTMAAGEFKAKCLQVMDQVHSTRTPVVITKRGKPIAKLVPAEQSRSSAFDSLKGRLEILGDIRLSRRTARRPGQL